MIKRFSIAIIFLFAFAEICYSQLTLLDSLRAYWRMDEGSGNIVDVHNSILDTAKGDGLTYSQAGIVGTSINFAGSDDYFTAADNADLQIAGDMSISMWIDADALDVNDRLIQKRDAGGTNYDFYFADPSSRLRFFDGIAASSSDGTTTITTGGWVHVVITIAGDSTVNGSTFYISSVDNGNGTFKITKDDAPLYIAIHYDASSDYAGNIDEIGIWSRKLTSTEVKDLYNDGRGLAYPLTPTLSGIIPRVNDGVIQPKVDAGVIQPKVRN